MKNSLLKTIMITGFIILCNLKTIYGQVATLAWPTMSGPYVCGVQTQLVDLKISFAMCPTVPNCNTTQCLLGNPYRGTITLYKNGAVYQTRTFNIASDWFNETFYNVQVSAGSSFYATVVFERKTHSCIGYTTIANLTTNNLNVPVMQGTPNFNINNVAVPANYAPMNVCASNIRMNAAATTCETAYFISIKECDQFLNRTMDYEINVWLNGEAPDNINLQNIATAYSTGSYFTGSASRQGSPLIGGNLPNGNPRYYTVSLCIGPTFTCKGALIKVNGACRTSSSQEDTNEYTVISEKDILSTTTSPASIDKMEIKMAVYPNPSKSIFHVSFEGEIQNGNISVFDYTGKEIIKNPVNDQMAILDLASYAKGMYFIVATSGNASVSKTIVLE
jgi:hypothetical protein